MIEFTKSYKTSDGQVFGSIEAAQEHEVFVALKLEGNKAFSGGEIAKLVLDNKDILIDILTTTPNSKPKARAIHGGTKPRKPKTVITNANVSLGSSVNKVDNIVGLPTS